MRAPNRRTMTQARACMGAPASHLVLSRHIPHPELLCPPSPALPGATLRRPRPSPVVDADVLAALGLSFSSKAGWLQRAHEEHHHDADMSGRFLCSRSCTGASPLPPSAPRWPGTGQKLAGQRHGMLLPGREGKSRRNIAVGNV